MTIAGETISAPSAPVGPAAAVTGTASTYSAGGAVSSVGNQVRYELFWGDGSLSGWLPVGTASASHSWPGPGTYTVTAQARSAANSQILSPVSAGLTLTVTAGETISTPTAPAGPTAGAPATSYTYSTGGAVSSSGNAVAYLFDWGDGQTSAWLPAGTTSASHSWPSAGSYTVTALAADATDLLIRSSVSSGTAVNVMPPPSIASLNPASASVGDLVTITGSNFGLSQGTSTVTFNGIGAGAAYSWGPGSIVVFVPDGATTGSVIVTTAGGASGGASFTLIPTFSITSVSPTVGIPGITSVTITGSAFGATQGSGQVWLGTANGVVQSWSDTQIVAQVAADSLSGNVMVLQNGVMLNGGAFTVDALQVASIRPTSGGTGTAVTFTGSGFGNSPGAVWLGSTNADSIVSWSDTQVVATVASTALSGVAKIQQNGAWSNVVGFTVPSTAEDAVSLRPVALNMSIGDSRALQALGSTGRTVTGLIWATSHATVVSLSTDDPPVPSASEVALEPQLTRLEAM